jgi:3-oxoacyl-[acyl-carrier-protein] synthase III
MKATITGIGHYLPNKVIDNKFLSDNYNITEEYILNRTGIKERRYVDEGITTSDVVCSAIRDLLKNASKSIEDIDCIIVGTLTPDYFFPSTAVCAINQLKAKNAWGFDLSAACSGFCYGMATASAMIQQGALRNAIVCGADRMSTTLNNFDYRTAVLFGDGAGAVLLEASDDNDEYVIKGNLCRVEADNLEDVYFKTPFNTADWGSEKFELQGGKVYRSGVQFMAESVQKYLHENNLTLDDFTYIIPHQSNMNMLIDTAKLLEIDISKFKTNIEVVGNTGGASIPICLSECVQNGEIKKGDRLLLVSFGAGYTVSIIDLVWAY